MNLPTSGALTLRDCPDAPLPQLSCPNDMKRKRLKCSRLGVIEHIGDVVERQRFPLMQADQDVAFFDAGFRGWAALLEFDDFHPAVKLAIDARHQLRRRGR